MTNPQALWSFVLVVGLLTLTPGLDTALIVRTAALGRRRQAGAVVAGIQTGTLVWGVCTSLGITALLTASTVAYETLRWVGAAYLIWLGTRMVWSTRRSAQATMPTSADVQERGVDDNRVCETFRTMASAWRRGAATNLLNPKVGAFYVALLPQFMPAGESAVTFGILLTGVHIALGLLWSTILILIATQLRSIMQRPGTRIGLDRVTGTIVAAFGIKLALDR